MKKKIKTPFIAYHLLKQNNYFKTKQKKQIIKTWSRSSTIIPCMTNTIIALYNGQQHIPIYISEAIIGYKLGEFALTKKFNSHKKKEKKIKNEK